MTVEERQEAARLRSERWRRAHGIMPRRPAQRPWLAEGISRSTWYARRKAGRKMAARRAAQKNGMHDPKRLREPRSIGCAKSSQVFAGTPAQSNYFNRLLPAQRRHGAGTVPELYPA